MKFPDVKLLGSKTSLNRQDYQYFLDQRENKKKLKICLLHVIARLETAG